jgi:hypothetical protein
MYVIDARKNSSTDDCVDQFSGKVHSKDDCDALVEVLKKLGYLLQVSRVNSTHLIDDPFPGEEDD